VLFRSLLHRNHVLINFKPVRSYSIHSSFVEVSEKVAEAIRENKPVVALESTIITHGLPYPSNHAVALEVESIIESEHAVPATIALLNGKLKVGLTKQEIEHVAKSHKSAIKLSRRDLSFIFASQHLQGVVGGTTVSATMIAAHAAHVPIFVTGGIGGVHRDFAETLDVSADLFELARTPVAVISSGIKSILDIGKTLEYLETLGVCVCSLNPSGSKEFPAFYTSKSGHFAPYNCQSASEAAQLIHTHMRTGLNSGLLIGVPIPEKHSIDETLIEQAINEALASAKSSNIKGKQVTPFLLDRLNKLTGNKTLSSNLELIKNNAKVGAEIARELSRVRAEKLNLAKQTAGGVYQSVDMDENPHQIAFIGGINVDFTYKLKDSKTMGMKGVTQACSFNSCLGGVGRNMAESLYRLGIKKSTLISAVSNDMLGKFVIDESRKIGFDTTKWLVIDQKRQATPTGSYCSLFDTDGELLLGCGAMDAHDFIEPGFIKEQKEAIRNSSLCVIDADIPVKSISYVSNLCEDLNLPVWFNATDVSKCTRVVEANSFDKLTYISLNIKELFTIFGFLMAKQSQCSKHSSANEMSQLERISAKYEMNKLDKIELPDLKKIIKYLLHYVPFIVLSRGENDLIFASAMKIDVHGFNQLPLKSDNKFEFTWSPHIINFPVIKLGNGEKIVNVSGAGDNATAGIIYGIIKNYSLAESVYNGLLAAKETLLTDRNVSESLSDSINLNSVKELVKENEIYFVAEKL